MLDYIDARTDTGGGFPDLSGSEQEIVCSRLEGIGDGIDPADPDAGNSIDAAALIDAEKARIRALPGNGETTPIRVLVDRHWMSQTHEWKSNEAYVGLAGRCGFKKRGIAHGGSNGKGMFRPANPVAPPTAPSTHRVSMHRLYLDGNRRDGGSGQAPDSYEHAISNTASPRPQVVACLQIWGVNDFSAVGLRFHDSVAYCYHLCNVDGFHIEDSHQSIRTGDTFRGNDHFHCNGHVQNGVVLNTRGRSNDDWFAINARDGHDLSSGLTFEPFVVSGPIRRIRCAGAYLDGGSGSGEVARFLTSGATGSAFRIEGIVIEDVETADAMDIAGATFDNFGISGTGELRDCVLRDWRVNAPVALDFGDTNVLGLRVENLVLRSNAGTGAVVIESGASIRRLEIDGLVADAVLSVPAVHSSGTVRLLSVGGLRWLRTGAASALPIGAIQVAGGTVECLDVSDARIEWMENLVRHSGGGITDLVLDNVRHANDGGSGATVLVTGSGVTTAHLRAAAMRTRSLSATASGGAITVAKHDGTAGDS